MRTEDILAALRPRYNGATASRAGRFDGDDVPGAGWGM
nr:MAG TPA: hypothetical protein [Caudoviricetes sp.]DAI94573.1 MAG TPA: hypothetical protein [Caudoviricetes sp.]